MNYNLNSLVNKQEQTALKEMIFNRIKERNQNLSENVQSDVMELARDAFVSKNNPFSQILETQTEKAVTESKVEPVQVQSAQTISQDEEKPEIGFPQRQFAPRAIAQNRVINDQISASTVYNNMAEAREGLTRKKGFMGALDFLNAQAAISLARVNRMDRFEMIV